MTTLLTSAEVYYQRNREVIDAIVAEVKTAGFSESDIDELVHDGAERGGSPSRQASDVNNAGLTFQIAFVIEGNGIVEGTRIIREELGIGTPNAGVKSP